MSDEYTTTRLRHREVTEAFKIQAHRQSLAVARSTHARDDQDSIDAVSDRGDE